MELQPQHGCDSDAMGTMSACTGDALTPTGIIVIILVVLALGALGYFAYRFLKRRNLE